MTSVPLVDLVAQHVAVADEIAEGWRQVLASTSFIAGPQIAAFEAEYAAFIGTAHCVGVANGTDAIEIALRALDVGPGGECILPANTFIATADAVKAALTPRTRVIIPVHLYGQAAPLERLLPLAEEAGAWVVEDAAQSQGARRRSVQTGALGHVAATSFYP